LTSKKSMPPLKPHSLTLILTKMASLMRLNLLTQQKTPHITSRLMILTKITSLMCKSSRTLMRSTLTSEDLKINKLKMLPKKLLMQLLKLLKPLQMPQLKLSRLLKIKQPRMLQIKLPKMPQIKLPRMLQIKLPKMPRIKLPRMPQIKLPRMPQIKLPRMPQIKLPRMLQIKLPRMLQIKPKKQTLLLILQLQQIPLNLQLLQHLVILPLLLLQLIL
jgi:predicted XRE-type DNA-binding protein